MFIVSLLMASLFITGIVALYVEGANRYGVTYGENVSGLDQYSAINSSVVNIKDQVANQTQSTGGFNILGDFLSYGYNAVKISLTSIDIFNSMNEEAFSHIPSSIVTTKMKAIIFTVVFIIIIFGIIAILTNRNQL